MRKALKILAVSAALVLPLAAASGLYAHESQAPAGTTMGSGMMGQGGTPGMTGQGGMMGQMTKMMETCDKTMQSMMDTRGRQMPGGHMPQTTPQTQPKTPDTNG